MNLEQVMTSSRWECKNYGKHVLVDHNGKIIGRVHRLIADGEWGAEANGSLGAYTDLASAKAAVESAAKA